MKINGRNMLDAYKQKHVDVRAQIDAWVAEAMNSNWNNPMEIKAKYSTASIIGDKNVIFNLKGNKYRLWVQVNYRFKIVLIKKIGNHEEYMEWKIN